MKKTLKSLLCILMTLLLLAPLPSAVAEAKQTSGEDELIWSNLNPAAVKNGPTKDEPVIIDEDGDPILVHRISTYHWNDGKGAEPGTISVYEDDEELGTWEAVGRSGSGAENAYWDVDVELIFHPGRTYIIKDSDPDTWSWNNATKKCGMFELYGQDPAPEDALKESDEDLEFSVSGITVYLDGEEITFEGDDGKACEPVVINGTVYLPALSLVKQLGSKIRWDKSADAIYIGEHPDEEIPSHCWVLTDTVHEVSENISDAYSSWGYEYRDIDDGGQNIIEYTFSNGDEHAHYISVGEFTNIPAYLLPYEYAVMDLHTYAKEVSGNAHVWGIPEMTYIDYHFNEGHHPSASDYTNQWWNVNEDDPNYYNCRDGEFRWQIHAKFPEGEPGETLEFSCRFHRGDRYPVVTTYTYEWHD